MKDTELTLIKTLLNISYRLGKFCERLETEAEEIQREVLKVEYDINRIYTELEKSTGKNYKTDVDFDEDVPRSVIEELAYYEETTKTLKASEQTIWDSLDTFAKLFEELTEY